MNLGEVPSSYWRAVLTHWKSCQNTDGGWGYRTAGKAGQVMARRKLALEPTVAEVDPQRCRGCGTCLEICEFHAPALEAGELGVPVAAINKASCKGCGTCVAWCPSGAITARHFTDNQINSMMVSLLQWEEA